MPQLPFLTNQTPSLEPQAPPQDVQSMMGDQFSLPSPTFIAPRNIDPRANSTATPQEKSAIAEYMEDILAGSVPLDQARDENGGMNWFQLLAPIISMGVGAKFGKSGIEKGALFGFSVTKGIQDNIELRRARKDKNIDRSIEIARLEQGRHRDLVEQARYIAKTDPVKAGKLLYEAYAKRSGPFKTNITEDALVKAFQAEVDQEKSDEIFKEYDRAKTNPYLLSQFLSDKEKFAGIVGKRPDMITVEDLAMRTKWIRQEALKATREEKQGENDYSKLLIESEDIETLLKSADLRRKAIPAQYLAQIRNSELAEINLSIAQRENTTGFKNDAEKLAHLQRLFANQMLNELQLFGSEKGLLKDMAGIQDLNVALDPKADPVEQAKAVMQNQRMISEATKAYLDPVKVVEMWKSMYANPEFKKSLQRTQSPGEFTPVEIFAGMPSLVTEFEKSYSGGQEKVTASDEVVITDVSDTVVSVVDGLKKKIADGEQDGSVLNLDAIIDNVVTNSKYNVGPLQLKRIRDQVISIMQTAIQKQGAGVVTGAVPGNTISNQVNIKAQQ